MQIFKRKIAAALAVAPLAAILSACQAAAMETKPPPMSEAQKRFKGMGATLVVDAVEGAEMLGVEFFADDREFPFYAKSRMVRNNREIMSLPTTHIPEKVRVIWRKSDSGVPPWWSSPNYSDGYGNALKNYIPPDRKHGRETNELYQKEKIEKRKTIVSNLGIVHQGPWGGSYFGQVLGDHTIPIASRIPDAVLQEIRDNGGGLRLKFRLKPDGVLFGWDIERFSGGLPRHSLAGGDFREAGLAYDLPDGLVYKAYLDSYTDTARINPALKPYLDSKEYFIPPRAADVWRKGWFINSAGRKILTEY